MEIHNTRTWYILLGIAVLAILAGVVTLSVWGAGASGAATPTLSVDAIYTSAFQTFTAQQATQLALTPPTPTPSPTLFPTLPVPTQPLLLPTAAISPTGPSGVVGCDNSVYVKDVTVPDGTVMTPGQTFVKTWLVQNSGTCTWSPDYKIAFGFGEAMGGSTTVIGKTVAPGMQAEITVNLTAPARAGDYTGNWKMQNNKGEFFGTYLTVVIKVSGAANTATPGSPTDTPEPTETP
jgi:Ig-like domain-containing protein